MAQDRQYSCECFGIPSPCPKRHSSEFQCDNIFSVKWLNLIKSFFRNKLIKCIRLCAIYFFKDTAQIYESNSFNCVINMFHSTWQIKIYCADHEKTPLNVHVAYFCFLGTCFIFNTSGIWVASPAQTKWLKVRLPFVMHKTSELLWEER